jgi:molybdenum cofactor cytidylyltransferase
MELNRAFQLPQADHPPRVAFVGAGGKTSAMFQSARGLVEPVLVTATSHLAESQIQLADQHFFEDQIPLLEQKLPFGVTLVTGAIDKTTGRTHGMAADSLNRILALATDHQISLLIEADGSQRLPLKAPAVHEPPIPAFVDMVVVVAGLSGLGYPLIAERVHRPEIFAELSGLQSGELVTPTALCRVLTHPAGGLKNIPSGARRLALLNQADTPELQAQAAAMAKVLLPDFDVVVISALQNPQNPVFSVHESIAGVILAAGEARRFGHPKQLLDWHGQPLIWHVAWRALQAGLSPVVVVCGQEIEAIRQALQDLPVEIIDNFNWSQGQGTSVSLGTQAVASQSGGCLFLLADQPQIPVALIQKLVAEHAQFLSPITAPLVNGQRANPVLFDRATYPDLQALAGEVGGRKLFSKFPIHWVPWHDPAPLLDVDTPEDYQRLLELPL